MKRGLSVSALVLLALAGCAAEERASSTEGFAAGAVEEVALDPERVWATSLLELHLAVDADLAEGRDDEARRKVAEAFEAPSPDGVREERANEARQDLAARLASLALAEGSPEAALEWVARGLARPAPSSPFEVNLHLLAARVHERSGSTEEAERARAEARRTLMELPPDMIR